LRIKQNICIIGGLKMEIQRCIKESFSVIGKEGSTNDGNGFIQKLWADANSHFNEVAELAKKDEEGNLLGIWGAMSDLSHSFNPWENNFSKGLYLAGVEVTDDAQAPKGWVKWTIPSYEYIYVKNENTSTFVDVIKYLKEIDIQLVGAVHDFNCPETGQSYMFFPVRKL
jgi:predicted transcriptional regulator YdeE